MKHIVLFSCGAQSSYTAFLVAQDVGKENVILLRHDPKAEDEDNSRFAKEMSAYLSIPVTERSDGRSPWELFEDEEFLGNNRIPICSRVLKREVGMKFLRDEIKEPFVLYLGYNVNEPGRVERTGQRYFVQGITTSFPLFERGINKNVAWKWLLSTGIKPPRIYETLQHANCIGCVRGGRGHWWAVWKFHLWAFERAEKAEERFGHTIMSDISLADLRKKFEEGYVPKSTVKEGRTCDCWE